MELLQLTYFCDAAESENFSRTAEKFRVPTSNISQVIRRLEDELGRALFDRRGNRVRLNADGRMFYLRARSALNSLSEGKRLLADSESEVRGELRVLVDCNRATVARAIEKFRSEYPHVFFSLDHHRRSDATDYDLIVSDHMDKNGYAKRLLVREKLLVAVSVDHPLAMRSKVDIAELADTRFLTMHEESSLSRLFHNVCREAGFEPNVVIRCDDPAYLRRYMEMGLGALFFPAYSWQGLFSDGVVFLELQAPIFRDTYVFFRTDRTPSRGAELFAECLEQTFSRGTV